MPRWQLWSDLDRSVAWAAVAALAWAIVVEIATAGGTPAETWVSDLVVGLALIVSGLVAASAGERRGVGALLVVAGASWFAGNLIASSSSVLVWLGEHTLFVHRAVLVHAAMQLGARRNAFGLPWIVGVVYASTFVDAVMVRPVLMIAWSVVVVVGGVLSTTTERVRLRRWAAFALVLLGATIIVVAAEYLTLGSIPAPRSAITTYQTGIVATAVAIASGAVMDRFRPDQVADAVIEIALGPAGDVRALLSDALRDPGVQVAFAASDRRGTGWVDEFGRSCGPLVGTDERSIVDVAVDGRVIAQLSCDTGLAGQSRVVAAVEAATALAARNARLRASLRAEAVELEQSRRRLVVAAGEQRVQLADALDKNTAASMETLAVRLNELALVEDPVVTEIVSRSGERLDALRVDLRSLASGLGPTSLGDGDLAAALGALTAPPELRLAFDVDVDRVPRDVATTAYFVCAEALSNAVKHAEATTVTIRVHVLGDVLQLVVADDGRGGAGLDRGAGLRGLADRVAALDGTLGLVSEPGAGTELTVTLPITRSGATP